MSYKGKFTPTQSNKYKGDSRNIIYRSLWELKFMKWCDKNVNIMEWSSEEFFIPHRSPLDNRVHRYFPDFYMKVKESNGKVERYVIEVKPKRQCSPPPPHPKRKTKKWFGEVKTWGINEAKWKYATEWCNNNNMEFKILTEDHLDIRYK